MQYEVIIIGGSFAGLSAAMALGRSLRKVLIIDDAEACNRYAKYSHNFITNDGESPAALIKKAKGEVLAYPTISWLQDRVKGVLRQEGTFSVTTASNTTLSANKILFATGVRDISPEIKGFKECWGVSIMHCPYCHGYESRQQFTAILANGHIGYNFCKMLLQWTQDLVLITNGPSELDLEQSQSLTSHGIQVLEQEIEAFVHKDGNLEQVLFKDGHQLEIKSIYTKIPFEQHCQLPEQLGCDYTEGGLIAVDQHQRTTVEGVYAAGDNSHFFRALSVAVAAGTIAGATINRELTEMKFAGKLMLT